jgi:hypothetical protein
MAGPNQEYAIPDVTFIAFEISSVILYHRRKLYGEENKSEKSAYIGRKDHHSMDYLSDSSIQFHESWRLTRC